MACNRIVCIPSSSLSLTLSFVEQFVWVVLFHIIAIVSMFLSHQIECECMLGKMDCLWFRISTHALLLFRFAFERSLLCNIREFVKMCIQFNQHSKPHYFGHFLITHLLFVHAASKQLERRSLFNFNDWIIHYFSGDCLIAVNNLQKL